MIKTNICAILSWFFERRDQREIGKLEQQVKTTKEAYDAKQREAEDYAAPRSSDWAGILKRLQRPSG